LREKYVKAMIQILTCFRIKCPS